MSALSQHTATAHNHSTQSQHTATAHITQHIAHGHVTDDQTTQTDHCTCSMVNESNSRYLTARIGTCMASVRDRIARSAHQHPMSHWPLPRACPMARVEPNGEKHARKWRKSKSKSKSSQVNNIARFSAPRDLGLIRSAETVDIQAQVKKCNISTCVHYMGAMKLSWSYMREASIASGSGP